MTNGHPGSLWGTLIGVLHRSVFFVAHALELLAFVAVVRATEWALELIQGGHEPIFFDRIPLHYMIHGADVALFLVFVYKGLSHFSKL